MILTSFLFGSLAHADCPPADLTVQENFDLDSYTSAPWWIQEQMAVSYLPVDLNYCVHADYEKGTGRFAKFLGWTITVNNFSKNKDGKDNDGKFICAKQVDGAKLEVAPCFLPPWLAAGPYWVLEYNQDQGYALVSGGAPTKDGADGKCKTGSGINNSGLWIFTRKRARDETLITTLKQKLSDKGFDVSVLNSVDNTNCDAEARLTHTPVIPLE